VEIKIGIEETPRELVVVSNQSQEEVEKLVLDALRDEDGMLRLTDDKGRTFLVPGDKIAYIEMAPTDARRVGFAVSP
jgi:hypothetical protein